MATNLSLDSELIKRALEVSGEKTKKAAVTRALEEFIARRYQIRPKHLMRKGKPMARLSPIKAPVRKKRLGLLKGKIKVPTNFNAALDRETLAAFEGLSQKGVVHLRSQIPTVKN